MRENRSGDETSGRFAGWFGPVVWVLLVVLAAQAWVWTGRLQRAQANQAFDQRTQVAADFTRSYLEGILSRFQQDAARTLTGRTVDRQQLDLFTAGFGFAQAAVLDAQGRLVRSWPAVPEVVGSPTLPISPYARAAARQDRPLVTDVFVSRLIKVPIVAVAVPFRTPYGIRVFTGGFDVASSPLGVYLRDSVAATTGRAYYVDRRGNVAAATVPLPSQVTPLSRQAPGLARALGRRPSGSYRRAGTTWRYSSAGIGGRGWRLVAEVPQRVLYAQSDHVQQHFAMVLASAALLGLTAAAVITAVTRRRRWAEQQLRDLNTQYARQATDLQASNTELEASNTELEAFSYSVAHDLRAPLRAMTGYAEILLEDHTTDDPADETVRLLTRIRTNAVTMAELIDALLSFSQLQRRPLRPETVDLTQLTRAVWDTLTAHRTGPDIIFDLADLPPCQGDPVLLAQALTNLLDNAIKFTRDQPTPRIEVGGRPGPQGFATYDVRDNGAGFDPDHAGHLFEPFQRLHPPGAYEGVGIGLSLTRRIIARHGGHITAESTPGQGATITFTLPTP